MSMRFSEIQKQTGSNKGRCGQEGSVIVIVLMLLAAMSIIGIASSNLVVTEGYIVRNTGIRKQNIHLADAVAMEAVQRIMDAGLTNDDPANTMGIDEILPGFPMAPEWIRDKDEWIGAGGLYEDWYDPTHVGPILDEDNSRAPESLLNGDIDVLADRGDWAHDGTPASADACPMRYALVGWSFGSAAGSGNLNLAAGQPILRTAHILAEYLSEQYGIIRLTMGVGREFMY